MTDSQSSGLTDKRSSLLRDQRGLTTVEYVIVLCLIAAAAVGTWQEFGTKVKDWLGRGEDAIDTEVGTIDAEGAATSQEGP